MNNYQHAIVMEGSLGGLLTDRALSHYFQQLIIAARNPIYKPVLRISGAAASSGFASYHLA